MIFLFVSTFNTSMKKEQEQEYQGGYHYSWQSHHCHTSININTQHHLVSVGYNSVDCNKLRRENNEALVLTRISSHVQEPYGDSV
jgi:hypothetical protein